MALMENLMFNPSGNSEASPPACSWKNPIPANSCSINGGDPDMVKILVFLKNLTNSVQVIDCPSLKGYGNKHPM